MMSHANEFGSWVGMTYKVTRFVTPPTVRSRGIEMEKKAMEKADVVAGEEKETVDEEDGKNDRRR